MFGQIVSQIYKAFIFSYKIRFGAGEVRRNKAKANDVVNPSPLFRVATFGNFACVNSLANSDRRPGVLDLLNQTCGKLIKAEKIVLFCISVNLNKVVNRAWQVCINFLLQH